MASEDRDGELDAVAAAELLEDCVDAADDEGVDAGETVGIAEDDAEAGGAGEAEKDPAAPVDAATGAKEIPRK